MAPLITAALWKIGSTALRALGAKKGGVAATAASVIADVIDGNPGKAETVEEAVNGLPPEQRAEILSLILEREKVQADLEAKRITSASNDFAQEQTTHRAELAQTDVYTKRTRPHLARLSFYAATAYVASSIIVPLAFTGKQVVFDVTIYLALISPALTYMGVRTFDKVSDLLRKR